MSRFLLSSLFLFLFLCSFSLPNYIYVFFLNLYKLILSFLSIYSYITNSPNTHLYIKFPTHDLCIHIVDIKVLYLIKYNLNKSFNLRLWVYIALNNLCFYQSLHYW